MRLPRPRLRDGRPRLPGLSMNVLIPNIVTILSLCAGLTALRLAVAGRYEPAVIAILVSMVCDGLDGRLARMLHGQTKFGAELDSLSDFLAFGVAPGVTLFLWVAETHPARWTAYGWVAALFFAVCAALRLARFNTAIDEEKPAFATNYFSGVPTPAAAGMALLPLVLSFELFPTLQLQPYALALWLAVIGVLMVSRLPVWSGKKMRVPGWLVAPVLALVALIFAGLFVETWTTLAIIGSLYVLLLPLGLITYYRAKARFESENPAAVPAAVPPAASPPPAG